VIGVNVNSYDWKKLKAVMDKEKMTWRSFADGGSIVGTWNLPGTPTFYVIDHKGVIRYKWVGGAGEKTIDAALGKVIEEAEGAAKKEPD